MKTLVGTVRSVKTAKTAHVEVESFWMHPMYRKAVKNTTVYACHDEVGVKEGDKVSILECKPVSKTKKFKITGIEKK